MLFLVFSLSVPHSTVAVASSFLRSFCASASIELNKSTAQHIAQLTRSACRCLTGFEGARCEQVTLDSVFGFGYALHSSSDFESTSSESQLAALSATFSSVESGDAELVVGDRTRAGGTGDADAESSAHRRGRRSAAATRVDIVVPMEYPSGAEASGSGTRVAAAADRREGDTDATHNTASGSGTDKSSSRSVSK